MRSRLALLTIPFLLIVLLARAGAGYVPERLPSDLAFAQNKNQWAPWVKYIADLNGGKLILEQTKMSFFLYSGGNEYQHRHSHQPLTPEREWLLRLNFKGANQNATIIPSEKQVPYRNYYLGSDPSHWASNVGLYGKAVYHDLYPGIDAEVYGSGGNLKYQFRVRPGSDASVIALQYEGAEKLRIEKGELKYATGIGEFTEQRPVAYISSSESASPQAVSCKYSLDPTTHTVTFKLGAYDHSKELVIDPTLVFVSYTGSTADNWGFSATFDPSGSFYAGGIVFQYRAAWYTNSGTGSYPVTAGAFQSSFSGQTSAADTCDIAISKFNSTGTQLLYSTYLGGNGNDRPHSMIVNSAGELYIFGTTLSTNYPTTTGAYSTTNKGKYDLIVTKMNASGTALLGSTYVGGTQDDGYNLDLPFTYNYGDEVRGEIILDANDNVYIASGTKSSNFPVTPGCFQSTYKGQQDGVVLELNPSLTSLVWASYLGGDSNDAAYAINIDNRNNLVVTGPTASRNFPTVRGGLHTTYQGGSCDGFVCKINATGTSLQASTYLGTSDYDQCYFVQIDKNDRVYVVGQTLGSYPVQNANYSNAGGTQFIQILSSDLQTSQRSTVFGSGTGAVNISPTAFLVDNCYNVYVAGWGGNVNSGSWNPATGTTNGLPVTSNAIQSSTDGSDMYFFVLSKDLNSLKYASFYGYNNVQAVGEHVDGGTCRFDKNGTIYSAVCSDCNNNGASLFPATAGAYSTQNRSGNCNYSALKFKIDLAGTNVGVQAYPRATGCVPLTVQFNSVLTNVHTVKWNFGDNTTDTVINPIHTYQDTGTYYVQLIGIDSTSCNFADTAYIDVRVRNDSLIANFSDSIDIDCNSKKVTLTSSNYATTQYLWDFGDGNTSSTPNTVSHVYNIAGKYTITLTVTDTTKCNLTQSYQQTVYIPPVVNIAAVPSDTSGCIPLTVKFQNFTPNSSGYHWDFGNGDTSIAKSPIYTYTRGGHYTVVLKFNDSTTCNKTDQASYNIWAIDSSADAGFTVNRQFYFCDSVRVTVQSFYTGEQWEKWDFGNGFRPTGNPITYTFKGLTDDTITHIVYDSTRFCHPYDTARVIISLHPLQTSISIPDSLGCVPFRTLLYGISPLFTTQYYWTFPNGDTLIGNPVAYTFRPVGKYVIKCVSIDSNACVNVVTNYDTVTVIDDSTRAYFDLDIIHQCDSDLSFNLINRSTNALQYRWEISGAGTFTTPNHFQQFTTSGTYTVKLVASDSTRCHPRDSITKSVTLKPNTVIDFTASDICLGQPITFINHSNPLAKYAWRFGDKTTAALYSPTHLYLRDSVYLVRLTMIDTSTCNVYDTITKPVTVFAQPLASFTTTDDTFLFDTRIQFTNTSKAYNSSFWTFGDTSTSTDRNPIHSYDLTFGWHQVCLVVYNAGAPCRDTVCDSIYIRFVPLVGVPNAFSPNGDGINDEVKVEGKGIVEMTFTIYNRWGQVVYEGRSQSEGWNGLYKNVPQDMDVYTYTLDARLINKDHVQLKGNITLLR